MKSKLLKYILISLEAQIRKGHLSMEIRRSKPNEIDAILALYGQARTFMVASGNPNQWNENYPGKAIIQQDMANKNSYVCIDDGEIVGTFMFVVGTDPTYANIYEGKWLNEEPYGVVHRITSAIRKQGVATACLEWCYKKCGNIRIDTHRDNIPMQNLLKKLGYVPCGIIYLKNGAERIAYQKWS